MDKSQAIKLLQRIEAVYPKNPFANVVAREEYINAIIDKSFDTMNRVIDELLLQCSFFPTISEIYNKYCEIKKAETPQDSSCSSDHSNIKCFVCMDKGYMIIKSGYADQGIDAYCPECEKGKQHFYNGNEIKDLKHRRPFFTPPISEYYDLHDLKQKNKAEWEKSKGAS